MSADSLSKVNTCSPGALKLKLTKEPDYYSTFRWKEKNKTWYCSNPHSTYEVECEMFKIIYKKIYGLKKDQPVFKTGTYEDPVLILETRFLDQMKKIPGRVETKWCFNLTDENLEMWCSCAVEIFNKL